MDPKRLEGIPLFAALGKKERKGLAQAMDELILPEGDHLVDQGKLAHEFFVIEEGTAEVTKDGKHIADLGPGDFFGEMALISEERRNASVIASSQVRVIVMHAKDFRRITEDMPHVADQIKAAIAERSG